MQGVGRIGLSPMAKAILQSARVVALYSEGCTRSRYTAALLAASSDEALEPFEALSRYLSFSASRSLPVRLSVGLYLPLALLLILPHVSLSVFFYLPI